MTISETVARQREYFNSGATRSYEFRARALRALMDAIIKNEALINDALMADLHKPYAESYMTETGLVLEEISFHLKHLKDWMKDKRVKTPLAQFPAHSFIAPEPLGLALILAPWNYPAQLCLSPLAGAISAGDCAILKPSAYAPAVSAAMARIIGETFASEYIAVIEGGREQNSALLEERFDCIFFTGSVGVGKVVMRAAAENLTPVTLELGGKSPVIVDETADIALAARRVAFGKILNAGQTCVAPDYLLIHSSVKERFIEGFRAALDEFFPAGDMSDMPHIVSDKHFERVSGLMKGENAVIGGGTDSASRFIEPTLLDGVSAESPVMQEEIFGPLLPVLCFEKLDECVDFIRSRPKPLALYLFTSSAETERKVMNSCSFGGGCVNDVVIHLATTAMPFGGVGGSGMGGYHGKKSFETFSHMRSIVKKSTLIDLPLRYRPYSAGKLALIRRFMK